MKMSRLDDLLNKKMGKEWYDLELETLSLEIGAKFDDITVTKLMVLKSVRKFPETILNDADYFLRFVEVASDNLADPHHADIPTSLELDFALRELEHILGDSMEETNMLKNVVQYTVNNEGHGTCASSRLAKYCGSKQVVTEFTKAYETYAKDM